jgi:hypothetical protein
MRGTSHAAGEGCTIAIASDIFFVSSVYYFINQAGCPGFFRDFLVTLVASAVQLGERLQICGYKRLKSLNMAEKNSISCQKEMLG